jgi:hypothetical protein
MTEPVQRIEPTEPTEPMLHVRFEGMSRQLPLSALHLTPDATETEVRTALANYFDVAVGRFAPYVVERHENGNVTVRPEAVFG